MRQPGQKGGSLAWLHVTEPRAPRPMSRGAGKLYHLQKAVRGGGAARDHLTSAGASGPSAHVVDLELGSEVGPGGRVERIWRERELDSES